MLNVPEPYFPLTAFAGYSAARRALLTMLVDPGLSGVILSGPVGSGKSALMRSFGAFVRQHLEPDAPLVQVPVGVGEDRLLGGVDLDAALATGRRVARAGLIAEAHGGLLLVDDLPLLEQVAIASIASALETGHIVCEREGISLQSPARFQLLATAVPSEREVPFWFADKVAFLLAQEQRIDADLAHMLVTRLERFRVDPVRFYEQYDKHERALASQVVAARMLYGLITVGPVAIERLTAAATGFDVGGNRADVFAVRAARAHAALRGSRAIEDADINFAIATVLVPRSQAVAAESEVGDRQQPPSPSTPQQEPATATHGEGMAEQSDDPEAQQEPACEEPSEGNDGGGQDDPSADAEQIHDPVDFDAELPPIDQFVSGPRRATVSGNRGDRDQWRRGRHTRSLARNPQGKRIAVGATLRAAAPHQRERRAEDEKRVVVRAGDIRVKKFTERAGTLFIFCVDASGSMAANRMREAKGAVTELLQDAYVNRDSVALIAFRGGEAELLLPPTGSVERAKRSLDILPTGGGTPLAGALMKAYGLVAASRRKGSERVLVVLLTDGRANVPMSESPADMIMEVRRRTVREELDRLALVYRRDGIEALVIDTRQTYGAASEAVRLADSLGARYYYLPRIDAVGLASVVRQTNVERA